MNPLANRHWGLAVRAARPDAHLFSALRPIFECSSFRRRATASELTATPAAEAYECMFADGISDSLIGQPHCALLLCAGQSVFRAGKTSGSDRPKLLQRVLVALWKT